MLEIETFICMLFVTSCFWNLVRRICWKLTHSFCMLFAKFCCCCWWCCCCCCCFCFGCCCDWRFAREVPKVWNGFVLHAIYLVFASELTVSHACDANNILLLESSTLHAMCTIWDEQNPSCKLLQHVDTGILYFASI